MGAAAAPAAAVAGNNHKEWAVDCETEFYICSCCFHVAEARQEHHRRPMVHCPGYPAGHPSLKPPLDEKGNLVSRAPRWFVEQQWPHAVQKS